VGPTGAVRLGSQQAARDVVVVDSSTGGRMRDARVGSSASHGRVSRCAPTSPSGAARPRDTSVLLRFLLFHLAQSPAHMDPKR
jgi:hypothetical protein